MTIHPLISCKFNKKIMFNSSQYANICFLVLKTLSSDWQCSINVNLFFISLWICSLPESLYVYVYVCMRIIFLWCFRSFHWSRFKSNRIDRMNIAIKVWNFWNIFFIQVTRSSESGGETNFFLVPLLQHYFHINFVLANFIVQSFYSSHIKFISVLNASHCSFFFQLCNDAVGSDLMW